MRTLLIAAVCAAFAVTTFAAENHSDVFAKHWKTAGDYTLAIADQMPAENYGFKPVPEQMSFAEQLVHIAEANLYFFAALSGDKATLEKPKTLDKESVVKYVRASFEWCGGQLTKITPETLMKSFPLEGQQMSGHEVMMLAWDHTTHHRGQLIVYLRLKGIKPTDYKF
ncbi:MAG TPA: DinB family protein [Bryobacteraceae bacterium]|nr:DinB family protein [Bryobacteraceae bacterium]